MMEWEHRVEDVVSMFVLLQQDQTLWWLEAQCPVQFALSPYVCVISGGLVVSSYI